MIQLFNTSTKEKKLEVLYTAEKAYNAIWTAAEKCAPLIIEIEDCKKSIETDTAAIPSYKAASRFFLIIAAVLGVIYMIIPGDFLKTFLLVVLLIPSLLGALIVQFLKPSTTRIDANTQRVRQLELQLADAEKEVEAVKQQNLEGMVIRQELFPECKSPQAVRTFIRYFESGRADSLKEAKNLFAQEQYQGRMEQLSKEQIATAEAARRAAERAESAANSARAAAESADTQARWAAYEARKD